YEASSQLVFLAAKSGRRKIVRGGKDRMLAQPTAGGLHFRERPPAWLFHEMSSFLRFELAAGGPWGQDWACSDVRCTTAFPQKAEVHPQFRYVAEVPQAAVSNQGIRLFDDLVGVGEQRGWNFAAECFRYDACSAIKHAYGLAKCCR